MTYEEAKKRIEHQEVLTVELQEDMEALEKAIEALEKQIPKKPIFKYTINLLALDEPHKTDVWKCPTCERTYNTREHHCLCGQEINWSEEE